MTVARLIKAGALGAFALLWMGSATGQPAASREPVDSSVLREAGTTPKISGFYDLEIAYTYPRKAHWSRAVNRLQVTAEGELSDNIKYKLGARVDADPVYWSSSFYPDAVKRDQRFDAIWRENYLDFTAGDLAFRLGAQHIVWGEVVGLFFADVVSARDDREFVLPPFDIIRIPQWAARAEYFAGDAHVELVWIPVPTFDRIGKPGADFYPLPLSAAFTDAARIAVPQRPERDLRNSNYGIRGNTIVAGWDVAGFYYRSFSSEPTFYRTSIDALGRLGFEPRFDRIWQGGTTLTKDFGAFVFRGEAVYTHGRRFSSLDPSASLGTVRRQTLDYVVSAEMPFGNDGRVNVQAFQRVYFGGRDAIVPNTGDFGVSVLVSTKIGAFEPQLLWLQGIGGGGGLIRPRLSWAAAKNTTIAFGVDVFTGPSDSFFGRFNDRDRVYTEVRYDF